MSNMSYVMYENTYNDLLDCREKLSKDLENGDIQSDENAKKLIRLCKEIGEDFTDKEI